MRRDISRISLRFRKPSRERLRDPRAFLSLPDHGSHRIAMLGERVINHVECRDGIGAKHQRLRIEGAEAGFVHARAAAPWRGKTQVLEELRVLHPARPYESSAARV